MVKVRSVRGKPYMAVVGKCAVSETDKSSLAELQYHHPTESIEIMSCSLAANRGDGYMLCNVV